MRIRDFCELLDEDAYNFMWYFKDKSKQGRIEKKKKRL